MMNDRNFPEMPEDFDRRVRDTLAALPAQPAAPRRRPLRRLACIGLAAALCLGGTAFAASYQSWFSMLFPQGEDAALSDYVTAPEPDTAVAENDAFRVELEALLYDSSAGTGLIRFSVENLAHDGRQLVSIARPLDEYKEHDIVWADLVTCYKGADAELDFLLTFGEDGWCGGSYYLDTARSTADKLYVQGAFISLEDYDPAADTLTLNLNSGDSTLSLPLPTSREMPCLRSADGTLTLSQIGLRVQDADMYCAVDEIDRISILMKDGAELVVQDYDESIDHTLYALGQCSDSSEAPERYDVETAVLGNTFALEDVAAIRINDTEYPLA